MISLHRPRTTAWHDPDIAPVLPGRPLEGPKFRSIGLRAARNFPGIAQYCPAAEAPSSPHGRPRAQRSVRRRMSSSISRSSPKGYHRGALRTPSTCPPALSLPGPRKASIRGWHNALTGGSNHVGHGRDVTEDREPLCPSGPACWRSAGCSRRRRGCSTIGRWRKARRSGGIKNKNIAGAGCISLSL